MYRILFLCSLFSIWNYTTLFSTFYCDCCKDCCDCCNPNVITEPDIITDEDKELTPKILKHLKLDDYNLNKIIEEINGISNNIDKINRIIEYSKDIDWENECCPNTLIEWKDNECAYIAYFHLMLNNPYFLKFFLICNETMRRKDTYILNAICDLVKYCVEHPRFEGEYRGSVDKIMKAFFRKENGEYYYLKKSKNSDRLRNFYYERDEKGKIEHYYGSYLPGDVYSEVNFCLKIDLSINDLETEEKIKEKIEGIIVYETESIYPYSINRILNGQKVDEEQYNKVLQIKRGKNYIDLSKDEKQILRFERGAGKCKKILGIWISQWNYHFYAFTKNKDFWYNKNTLKINAIGQKDRENYMLPFMNAISETFEPVKDKDKIKRKIYPSYCDFIYIQ